MAKICRRHTCTCRTVRTTIQNYKVTWNFTFDKCDSEVNLHKTTSSPESPCARRFIMSCAHANAMVKKKDYIVSIKWLFLGSGLKINSLFAFLTLKNNQPIKSHVGIRPRTDMSTWWKVVLQTANSVKHCFKVAHR
jgi:hypothetical protein